MCYTCGAKLIKQLMCPFEYWQTKDIQHVISVAHILCTNHISFALQYNFVLCLQVRCRGSLYYFEYSH